MNLIYGQLLELLNQPARPANLHPVDFARRAQSEVQTLVGTVVFGAATIRQILRDGGVLDGSVVSDQLDRRILDPPPQLWTHLLKLAGAIA